LNFLLEILFSSGFFKFPADVLFIQRKIWISRWKIYFPADFLIFQLSFKISSGRSRVPLEIWIFCWKFYFPADFLIFRQIFRISSGIGFCGVRRSRMQKNGNRTDSASVRFP